MWNSVKQLENWSNEEKVRPTNNADQIRTPKVQTSIDLIEIIYVLSIQNFIEFEQSYGFFNGRKSQLRFLLWQVVAHVKSKREIYHARADK